MAADFEIKQEARMDERARAQVRERLLERQQELLDRKARLLADKRREVEPLSADAPDRAVQQRNDPVIDAIESAVDAELVAIESALARLDAGRYGICQTCGADISVKRLEAVPYAEQCHSCAAQANSRACTGVGQDAARRTEREPSRRSHPVKKRPLPCRTTAVMRQHRAALTLSVPHAVRPAHRPRERENTMPTVIPPRSQAAELPVRVQ